LTIGKRIKEYRDLIGKSQKEFAEALGVSAQLLQQYEYDKSKPGSPFLAKLRKSFDIDLNWLLTGTGEITINILHHKENNLPGHVFLPLLTNAGAASTGITEDAIDEKNFYAFRKRFIRHIAGGLDEESTQWLFLVRIKGDSMVPTFQEDEVALVNANPHVPFRQGAIYLIRDHVDMSTLAKRIYIFDRKITLHSDNPKYSDVVIPIDEHNTPERLIIGRIRWSSRLFD